jgi:FemAB-related protein (PEP-CTERM system-associated)
MRVEALDAGGEEAWTAFVRDHPDATPYHTLAWRAVTVEGLRHRARHMLARDASGTVMGVLPLFEVRGVFGRRLVAVPMRDRGGVLAANDEAADALVGAAVNLSRTLRCRYLELKSRTGLAPALAHRHGLIQVHNWITTRVDLTPGRDVLWKSLDKNAVRWAINNAHRNGVRVVLDESAEGIDRFATLFARTRTEMGIPVYPVALFHAIRRHMISAGVANLMLAYRDDTPINGMINLMWGDTFYPAYAAPQSEWRKSYPSETAIWHSIEWAVEHGYRTYDFGGDSPHQTGLLKFKKKWGGEAQEMIWDYHMTGGGQPPAFDSSTAGFRLARRVWRILPPAAGGPLGAWVTRQLS